MTSSPTRRDILTHGCIAAALIPAISPSSLVTRAVATRDPLFEISLAQWSLHRALRTGELEHLDFAATARNEFDIGGIEYVNSFFKDKAEDPDFLADMQQRASDHDVQSLLIMCDGEGRIGDPDSSARTQAIENHFRWVTAAKTLGCHSIRVNAASEGSFEEQIRLAADGLRRLAEFAANHDLNVIVENHGGYSSNGAWLARTIETVNLENCGTLPDFGNFRTGSNPDRFYDRYKGVAELMPFAKAVSAKSHDFDADGFETQTDYTRMMKIVLDAGYRGWVGIEYEGGGLDEVAGIRATLDLLKKVRAELAPSYR